VLGFALTSALVAVSLAALVVGVFLVHIYYKYAPIIGRIFDEAPMFAAPRANLDEGDVSRFVTSDGLTLVGTYLKTHAPERLGTIVFCPEYLGDRGSVALYTDGLREAGFDLFTFDFRNHGDSDTDPTYRPMQWVSDLELIDLRAALAHVRSRDDADPAGMALLGVSRGGGTALAVAAEDPTIWAVATDGAFPTFGTMHAYCLRWAEIYVRPPWLWRHMPKSIFRFAAWVGRVSSQGRHGRVYPSLERAVARIAPRPWLMIHGERDAYISPNIARRLFARARSPKESWIVPGAKHNRCQEVDPAAYADRLTGFFLRFAPRSSTSPSGPDLAPLHSTSVNRAPGIETASATSSGPVLAGSASV
jgi:pimeloyl-ACP methyl ester carboxylesterase